MDTAWVIAAIALAGAGFMLRFLIALLREGAPSACYWVVPVRRKPEKEKDFEALRRIYVDEKCRAIEANQSECYGQLLGNENHEREKCESGLNYSRRPYCFWQAGLARNPSKTQLRPLGTPPLGQFSKQNSKKCGMN